jgi:hypothetical protein
LFISQIANYLNQLFDIIQGGVRMIKNHTQVSLTAKSGGEQVEFTPVDLTQDTRLLSRQSP